MRKKFLDHIPSIRMSILAAALIISGVFLTVVLPPVPAIAGSGKAQSTEKIDFQRLAGRWVRPDGGYVLELKDITKDGNLKASYFNPRSINVAKAELRRKDGRLALFVELRDLNYPGSTYSLKYDPKGDRLIGTYFQAVERQTFDVEFQRVR